MDYATLAGLAVGLAVGLTVVSLAILTGSDFSIFISMPVGFKAA